MITFHSIMFVSLGFLVAVLFGFVIAPAFWARAVRLTTERMRASLPMSEAEIRAQRDQVRAESAVQVYRLTADRDKARLGQARQTIEINRRDAVIGQLEQRVQRVDAELAASENARRVLEASIKERMPEIEKRLVEARQLLAHRDSEMTALRDDTSKTYRALDDAMQMNAQQRSEIDRLKSALGAHTGRPAAMAQGAETEAALRSELEGLRARTRDQGDIIKRLQAAMRAGGIAADGTAVRGAASDEAQRAKEAAALAAVQEGLEASREALLAQVNTLSETVEAQAGEISGLKAQLGEAQAALEGGGAVEGEQKASLGSGTTATRNKLAAKDKQIAERDKTIAGLRRELAGANERIARQATYYMEELRRLGPGGSSRREDSTQRGLVGTEGADGTGDQLGAHDAAAADVVRPVPAAAEAGDREAGARGSEPVAAPVEQNDNVAARAEAGSLGARLAAIDAQADEVLAEEAQAEPGDDAGAATGPRPKLMDRIAGLAKR